MNCLTFCETIQNEGNLHSKQRDLDCVALSALMEMPQAFGSSKFIQSSQTSAGFK
jgi:hypothetical protein